MREGREKRERTGKKLTASMVIRLGGRNSLNLYNLLSYCCFSFSDNEKNDRKISVWL